MIWRKQLSLSFPLSARYSRSSHDRVEEIRNLDMQESTKLIVGVLIFLLLSALAVTAGAYYYANLFPNYSEQVRSGILRDIARGGIQLIVVGVIAAIVKFLLDSIAADRERVEKDKERERIREKEQIAVQKEMLDKLLAAHRKVRAAPNHIEAAKSAKTYGEQLRTIIDAHIDLYELKHQINASPDAFSESEREDVSKYLNGMSHDYLEPLIAEYRSYYKGISDMQKDSPNEVWNEIQKLPHLKDFRENRDMRPEHSGPSDYQEVYFENYNQCRELLHNKLMERLSQSENAQQIRG